MFKKGDKVIQIFYGWGRKPEAVKIKVIEKFYKNGNFVLEKGGTQYRENGFPAGSRFGISSRVIAYSSELYEEYAKPIRISNKSGRAMNLVEDCECEETLDKILEMFGE